VFTIQLQLFADAGGLTQIMPHPSTIGSAFVRYNLYPDPDNVGIFIPNLGRPNYDDCDSMSQTYAFILDPQRLNVQHFPPFINYSNPPIDIGTNPPLQLTIVITLIPPFTASNSSFY